MPDLPARFRLVRHQDLLVLEVELRNLHVSGDGARLERIVPGEAAQLILHLPSQHVAEEAFMESEGQQARAGPPPVKAMAAGPSRLVFSLPDGAPDMPLSVESILAWGELEPVVAPNALPPGRSEGLRPAVPGAGETAIEFPWRLLLSPDAEERWIHRTEGFASVGRTEVWHSRLSAEGRPVTVRAVGRRSVRDSFRSSLSDADLNDLVTLSGDFGIRPKSAFELGLDHRVWKARLEMAGLTGYHYRPEPVQVDELMLTALGASVRLRGAWDYPPPKADRSDLALVGMPVPSLQQYQHVAGLGRDQFVRVVRRGFVSTGHRASLVKITERRFETRQLRTVQTPQGPRGVFGATAYLRQYFQVVIQQPRLDYDPLEQCYPNVGREMPLRSLTFTTLATPKIDYPNESPETIERRVRASWIPRLPDAAADQLLLLRAIQEAVEGALKEPFPVQVGGKDFHFGVLGTDWDLKPVSFATPVVFVPAEAVTETAAVIAMFAEKTCSLSNQSMAIADCGNAPAGSTTVPVESLTFKLEAVPPGRSVPSSYRPRWVLAMKEANVRLEAVERVTGSRQAVGVTLARAYLENQVNPAEVFATLAAPVGVKFPSERGGGLARPDTSVSLLSRRSGAMSSAFAGPAPAPDPAAMFGGAKLFGTIPLAAIIESMADIGPADFAQSTLSDDELDEVLDRPEGKLRVPLLRSRTLESNEVEARFVWKPTLRSSDAIPGFKLEFDGTSSLVLDARTITGLADKPPRSEVRGVLRNVTLTFAEVIGVHMDRLEFTALPGRKPDITAEGFDLTFLGPLKFVNTLQQILPADGFSDPPAVSVSPAGISAGYTLGIPAFGVGVFSMENLSLSAALAIPFNDQPASFRFAVSERHHPFNVTVSLFGGGGFFAIGVSAKGVESIEAAIEFGGNLSLNLGVASGGVSVMAGIYFGMTGSETTLTGYLRCGGYVSVLGLISISVEFYLAFTYLSRGNEVWGQARLSVSVKVACFSKSVTLSVERRFAGASGDPTFDQVVEPQDWERYCLAFAS